MKTISFQTGKKGVVPFLILTAILSLFYSCKVGGQANGSGSSPTGSVIFGLSIIHSHPAADKPRQLIAEAPAAPAGIDCGAHDLGTFMGEVYDENGRLIAEGGPWNCEDHQGTMENVPAGENRTVAIYGYDTTARLSYRGTSAPFRVTANQSTSAGSIGLHQCMDPGDLGNSVSVPIRIDEGTSAKINYAAEHFERQMYIGKTGGLHTLLMECPHPHAPQNGVLSGPTDLSLTYMPNAGYYGPDSFSCTIYALAENGLSRMTIEQVFFDIAVLRVVDWPEVINDKFTTDENTLFNGDLFANVTDPDGRLKVTQVNGIRANVGRRIELASGAQLTVLAGGTFSYNPATSQSFDAMGSEDLNIDEFTFEISDAIETYSGTAVGTIRGVDDAPRSRFDSYVLFTHAQVIATSGGEGPDIFDAHFENFAAQKPAPLGPLPDRPAWIDEPLQASVENNTTVPEPHLDSGNFVRLVEPPGDATAIGFDTEVSFASGVYSVSFDLLFENLEEYHIFFRNGRGSGLPPDSQAVADIYFHADGSVEFASAGGRVTGAYVPGNLIQLSAIFDLGQDTWDVLLDGLQMVDDQAIVDGMLGRVGVGFGKDPEPSHAGRLQFDNLLFVPLQQTVLQNDTDPEGDPIIARLVDDVSYGTLQFNTDGSFIYVPGPGFEGEDIFTYRAVDGDLEGDTTRVYIGSCQPASWRPARVGSVRLPGNGRAIMHIYGDLAYIARWDHTFAVYDIKDRSAPEQLSQLTVQPDPSVEQIHDMWYAADLNYVFTAHRYGHVTMLDVLDPAAPKTIYDVNTNYTHHGIISVGDHLYVAEHAVGAMLGGMRVYEIVEGTLNPVGDYFDTIDGYDLAVSSDGRYVYQSTPHDDWDPHAVYAFDVLKPNDIQRVGKVPDIFGKEVLISPDDRFLYMSHLHWPREVYEPLEGVKIFDLSDRAQPVEIGTIALPRAQDLALDDARQLLYVRSYYENPGLYVFDISSPAWPRELHFSPIAGRDDIGDLWYADNFIYTVEYDPADDAFDLLIMRAYP